MYQLDLDTFEKDADKSAETSHADAFIHAGAFILYIAALVILAVTSAGLIYFFTVTIAGFIFYAVPKIDAGKKKDAVKDADTLVDEPEMPADDAVNDAGLPVIRL